MTRPEGAGLEQYVATFRARAIALGAAVVEEPGLIAFTRRIDDRPRGRVLVVDDSSAEKLSGLVGSLDIELVTVLGGAPRSLALLQASEVFGPAETGAAMVRADLEHLPAFLLPEGLRLARVQRTPQEPPGVSFEAAVAAAIAFDPDPNGVPVQAMRDFLLSLPLGRLLVALDDTGAVHATSASGVFGNQEAVVVMVSTDPQWRRRGVGSAMTAAALEAARDNGAVGASLDASELGEPIYRRLGFMVVDRFHRFANGS